jgi:hypothetical protein
MDINDELAELTYVNKMLRQEVRAVRQEKLFFARRQAALSVLIIAVVVVAAAVAATVL